MSAQPDDANARPDRGRGFPRIGPDLWPRVAASVVMGLAALAVAWTGGIVFAAFWWIVSVVVLWEWERIVVARAAFAARRRGRARSRRRRADGPAQSSAPRVARARRRRRGGRLRRRPGKTDVDRGRRALRRLAGRQPRSSARRARSSGLPAILWLFAIVWGADVAAYFAGRAIGGPRLWPSVSPGKTWSGAIAGALAGAGLGLALSLILVPGPLRIGPVFCAGARRRGGVGTGRPVRIGGQAAIRGQGSSRIIPGHGGLMDRLDSFIAASAFAAVVAAVNTRGSFIASGLFLW